MCVVKPIFQDGDIRRGFPANLVSFVIDQSTMISIKQLQAFKFQLISNGQYEGNMRCFAGACHFVFNRALAL